MEHTACARTLHTHTGLKRCSAVIGKTITVQYGRIVDKFLPTQTHIMTTTTALQYDKTTVLPHTQTNPPTHTHTVHIHS